MRTHLILLFWALFTQNVSAISYLKLPEGSVSDQAFHCEDPRYVKFTVTNHNSTITINYTLSPEFTNAYIVVVDLGAGNREVAHVPCSADASYVSAHVPYGVYAVSLMINDRPYHTKKIFVSHLSY